MRIQDFVSLPSVVAHYPEMKPAILDLLTTHLVVTAADAKGKPDNAQCEVGALRAIANMIQLLSSIEPTADGGKKLELKRLHRFSKPDKEKKPPSKN